MPLLMGRLTSTMHTNGCLAILPKLKQSSFPVGGTRVPGESRQYWAEQQLVLFS